MLHMPSPMLLSGIVTPPGQVLFSGRNLRDQTWTVPDGVTSIAVVFIGQGGNGVYGPPSSSYSGSGGSLAYYNTLTVTPGETLTIDIDVELGRGTRMSRGGSVLAGVLAPTGRNAGTGTQGSESATAFFRGGNGYGFLPNSSSAAGAGAGGYTSAGANAPSSNSTLGGGGTPATGGGSGASAGASAGRHGLNYGGGGAFLAGGSIGLGGLGAVRIMWGPGRSYPSNAGDV